jgi:hypothetical protein
LALNLVALLIAGVWLALVGTTFKGIDAAFKSGSQTIEPATPRAGPQGPGGPAAAVPKDQPRLATKPEPEAKRDETAERAA